MKPRLLVAYCNASTHVTTTMEYLYSFKRYSNYDVSYLHVTNGAEIDVDLNQFDAVFHSYSARLCFPGLVSNQYREALKRFRGVRVLAVQDEYDRTDTLRQAILDLKFDVVFTCVPAAGWEYVYPGAKFPDTEFIPVLTGYVPDSLKGRERSATPLEQRPVAIGYRGRALPARYGQLGFDKFEIGRRMRDICAARGIAHDIEVNEASRIYGDGWYTFLESCRATLGTESGSNIFDFDGSLAAHYEALRTERQIAPGFDEYRRYTDPLETKISMGQISPRIFEAAAVGTPLILFPGRYSEVIVPGEHYIELQRDFSNVDSVLEQLEDLDSLSALANRAYQHLVASGAFEYRRFVAMVDSVMDRKRAGRDSPLRSGGPTALPIWGTGADLLNPQVKETPTAAPRDFYYFGFKQLYFENKRLNEHYPAEIARLNAEIGRLTRLYSKASFYKASFTLRAKLWLLAHAPRMAMVLRRLKSRLRWSRR